MTLGRYVCGTTCRLLPSDLMRHESELADVEVADHVWGSFDRPMQCGLETRDGLHAGLLASGPHGRALWVRWEDGKRVLGPEWLPDCPETGFDTDGLDTGCCHYLAHPGGHTWEVTDPEWELYRAIMPVLREHFRDPF